MSLVMIDLDGVIYRGDKLIEYARDAINNLRKHNHKVAFVSNSTLKTRDYYVDKLRLLGLEVYPEELITAAHATAIYLNTYYCAKNKRVFLVGEAGIRKELAEIGVIFINGDHEENKQTDFVIVALDREFNYNKLAIAQRLIYNGAEFIAVNRDATWPVEEKLLPGVGGIVSAIETVTNRKARVVGKPQPYILELIMKKNQSSLKDSFIVGDRLDSDIEAGNRLGINTILVLTGATTKEEAEKADGIQKPGFIINDLRSLLDIIKK
ncbi:MAG: HAD-IIA family hydrolase [bacterium]